MEEENDPNPNSNPQTPSQFYHTLTKIAVSQICHSIGFTSAHSSALDTLSLIATLHLRNLSCRASSISTSQGRTSCTFLDVILSLESLHPCPAVLTPLLSSPALHHLLRFVPNLPFPCSIPRPEIPVLPPAVALGGRELPAEVPRWLPGFPAVDKVAEWGVRREVRWEERGVVDSEIVKEGRRCEEVVVKKKWRREKIRFRVGVEMRSNRVCRGGKIKRVCLDRTTSSSTVGALLDDDDDN